MKIAPHYIFHSTPLENRAFPITQRRAGPERIAEHCGIEQKKAKLTTNEKWDREAKREDDEGESEGPKIEFQQKIMAKDVQ